MKRRSSTIYAIICTLLLLAGFMAAFFFAWKAGVPDTVKCLVGLALGFILTPIYHEIGHIIFAKAAKMECVYVKCSCLRFYVKDGKKKMGVASPFAPDETQVMPKCGGDMQKVEDKTVFDGAAAEDPVSRKVLDTYLTYLAEGITNMVNIFQPAVVSIGGIVLEAVADKQKSEQKAKNPRFVATEGLYKIVRCPNYLGEITFWTGVFVSGVTAYQGWGQWITAILAYIAIVFIMFNGAQRLERRQKARLADDPAYAEYASKTPIILPLVPLYTLDFPKKEK